MGEVTPETVNGLVNAWLWLADTTETFGPGLALAGAAWAVRWAGCRAIDYACRRHTLAAWRRQLDEPPMQAGHDQPDLEECTAIWNADTRKEKP
ncbi:hypothetical protein [Streptomyces sp. NPDC050704]|uniref:hypothetical protein n=1 Tax=Streptomyces sp. NPDC050704 TaxID=3157219 RepID=UPI0034142CF5